MKLPNKSRSFFIFFFIFLVFPRFSRVFQDLNPGFFISFVRTKETKQRKGAGCTFLATPVGCSAKEKELASLKQLFLFYALHHSLRFTPKKMRPESFDATLLRSLTCMLSSTLSVIQSGAKNLGNIHLRIRFAR